MTKKIINQVQDYLTVVGEDRVYQIVNVELLLRRQRINRDWVWCGTASGVH